MKFTANASTLAPAVRRAAKIPPSGAAIVPAMQSVCLSATGESLTLTATDSAMWFSETLPVPADEGGVVCVNARDLDRIVGGLADGADVEIEKDPGSSAATIRADRATWTMPATDPDVLGTPPNIDAASWSLPGAVLLDALKACAPTMGHDEARYYFKGTHVSLTNAGELRIQSMNGACLTRVLTDAPDGIDLPDAGIILPDTTVQNLLTVLSKAEGTVHIASTDKLTRLIHGGLSITTRLNDSQYPDTDKIMPGYQTGVETTVHMLSRAITSATEVSDAKFDNTAVLEFQGDEIRISCENSDGRKFEAFAPATIDMEFDRLGINAKYFGDALRAIGETETVRITLTNGERGCISAPIVLTTESAPHVLRMISPVRV